MSYRSSQGPSLPLLLSLPAIKRQSACPCCLAELLTGLQCDVLALFHLLPQCTHLRSNKQDRRLRHCYPLLHLTNHANGEPYPGTVCFTQRLLCPLPRARHCLLSWGDHPLRRSNTIPNTPISLSILRPAVVGQYITLGPPPPQSPQIARQRREVPSRR